MRVLELKPNQICANPSGTFKIFKWIHENSDLLVMLHENSSYHESHLYSSSLEDECLHHIY